MTRKKLNSIQWLARLSTNFANKEQVLSLSPSSSLRLSADPGIIFASAVGRDLTAHLTGVLSTMDGSIADDLLKLIDKLVTIKDGILIQFQNACACAYSPCFRVPHYKWLHRTWIITSHRIPSASWSGSPGIQIRNGGGSLQRFPRYASSGGAHRILQRHPGEFQRYGQKENFVPTPLDSVDMELSDSYSVVHTMREMYISPGYCKLFFGVQFAPTKLSGTTCTNNNLRHSRRTARILYCRGPHVKTTYTCCILSTYEERNIWTPPNSSDIHLFLLVLIDFIEFNAIEEVYMATGEDWDSLFTEELPHIRETDTRRLSIMDGHPRMFVYMRGPFRDFPHRYYRLILNYLRDPLLAGNHFFGRTQICCCGRIDAAQVHEIQETTFPFPGSSGGTARFLHFCSQSC